jgi:maleylpyruvate isomerase
MDAAQRELSDQIDQATQRLLGTARIITEPDLRAPSLLPGWTRAHVLAHVARGADAMRHLLVGVRSGQDRSAYASAEAWQADIEYRAGLRPKELADDLAGSAMALRTVARQLPDERWRHPVLIPGSAAFPAAELLVRRLVERLAARLRRHGTRRADALPAHGPAHLHPDGRTSGTGQAARALSA